MAVACLLAASGVAIAATTINFPESGMGTQAGPTKVGDEADASKPPTHSIGHMETANLEVRGPVDTTFFKGKPKPKPKPKQVTNTFTGANFFFEPSVKAGENEIESELQSEGCRSWRLTDVHFNRFHYFKYVNNHRAYYLASNLSGKYTCTE
jgi:hypothetical protein